VSDRHWAYELEGSALCFRLADPSDPALDDFDCGVEEWSIHVTEYFRARRWLRNDRTCYQFGTDQDVIGYAAIAVAPCPHPDEASDTQADYLIIFMMGIDKRYQGATDPRADCTYYDSIMRMLATLARNTRACVGLYLRVNAKNERAIRAYRRTGFDPDATPGGTLREKKGTFLVMRKVPS
jgi:hypothetical protein